MPSSPLSSGIRSSRSSLRSGLQPTADSGGGYTAIAQTTPAWGTTDRVSTDGADGPRRFGSPESSPGGRSTKEKPGYGPARKSGGARTLLTKFGASRTTVVRLRPDLARFVRPAPNLDRDAGGPSFGDLPSYPRLDQRRHFPSSQLSASTSARNRSSTNVTFRLRSSPGTIATSTLLNFSIVSAVSTPSNPASTEAR